MTEKFICFDIGGTKIFKAVIEVNFAQRSYGFLDSETINNPVSKEKIEEIVLEYCEKNKEEFSTNKVAISSGSIVDYQNISIFRASSFYGEEEFSFSFLKNAGYQVVLENDGESFALGNFYFGGNEDVQGLLTLTLGSGIGGGFINSKGQVLRGKDNSATEFSHMEMMIDGKWEKWWRISAGWGICNLYKNKTGKDKKARDIFASIDEDESAKEAIKKAQEYLGHGVANLVEVFNPEKIIFGGSVSSQKFYLEGAMKIVKENVFNEKAFPEWKISDLKAEMNVLGVCALYYI